MIRELLKVEESKLLPEICKRLGTFLGLGKSIPLTVLLKAVDDQSYAKDLIASRNTPELLTKLLQDSTSENQDCEQELEIRSNLELTRKAVEALLDWGRSGFFAVDEATLERRENACLVCPNLVEPQFLVQKLIPSKGIEQKIGQRTGNKVCALCGCNVSKKIQIPSASCPDRISMQSCVTRWGDPIEPEVGISISS